MTHEQLAKLWLDYNGKKGTQKQIEQTVKNTPMAVLINLLKARKVIA